MPGRRGLAGSAACLYLTRAGPVAQLDRALPSEGRGRRFESFRVRQCFQHFNRLRFSAIASFSEVGPLKLRALIDPVVAALATGRAGEALGLQLHQALGREADHLAQHVGV